MSSSSVNTVDTDAADYMIGTGRVKQERIAFRNAGYGHRLLTDHYITPTNNKPTISDIIADNSIYNAFNVVTEGSEILKLHLVFEDSVGDISGNGNDFSVSGGISYVAGILGKAANFSGSSQSILAASSSILDQTTNDFSISCWIKPTTANQTAAIFSKRNSGATDKGYEIGLNSGYFYATICDGSASAITTTGTTLIPAGEWKIVTAVFDRDLNLKIYVGDAQNNLSPPSISSQSTSISNSLTATAANTAAGAAAYFAGAIDELRFYNRVLSTREIRNLYNRKYSMAYNFNTNNLILYCPFDNTHTDYSGNNQSINAVNSPTYTSSGWYDQALILNGSNQYIEGATSSVLDQTTNDFTIMCWVFLDINTTGYMASKRSTSASTNPGFRFGMSASGRLYGELCDGSAAVITKSASSILSISDWYHVGIVYDRDGDMIFYLDGAENARQAISTQQGSVSNAFNFRIGRASSTSGIYLDGIVDDFKMYSRVVPAEEFAKIYNDTEKGYGTRANFGVVN